MILCGLIRLKVDVGHLQLTLLEMCGLMLPGIASFEEVISAVVVVAWLCLQSNCILCVRQLLVLKVMGSSGCLGCFLP